MNGPESNQPPEKVPETLPATTGGPPDPPPRPPKLTARDLLEPGEPRKRVFLPDYIEVNDLAGMLELKPFKIVAELLEMGIFKHSDEFIEFETAAAIARKHGFTAEKLL
jgi:translation initiation factor IF-2